MNSNIQIQKNSRENNVSEETVNNFKALINKRITKSVKFMNGKVEIAKLSVAEVMEIQNQATEMAGNEEAKDSEGFNSLKEVIRMAVDDAKELDDEDFDKMPLGELINLSNEIMKFSGIDPNAQK